MGGRQGRARPRKGIDLSHLHVYPAQLTLKGLDTNDEAGAHRVEGASVRCHRHREWWRA